MNELPEYIRSYELSTLSGVAQGTIYKCIERKSIEVDAWVRAGGHGVQPLFLSVRIPKLLAEIKKDRARYQKNGNGAKA
jgi:hypothetical protein